MISADKLSFIKNELSKFDYIHFQEEDHKYLAKNRPFIFNQSVTGIINQYMNEFDSEYWSQRKAAELGISADELKKQWNSKGNNSINRGNKTHNYIENDLTGGDNSKIILPKWLKKQVSEYLDFVHNNYIFIDAEKNIGDPEVSIAGRIDTIYYDPRDDNLVLDDHKTYEKFTTYKPYHFNGILKKYDTSHKNKVMLQLSFYKHIIMKCTGLTKIRLEVSWFSKENDTYKIIPIASDLSAIKRILSDQQRFPGR